MVAEAGALFVESGKGSDIHAIDVGRCADVIDREAVPFEAALCENPRLAKDRFFESIEYTDRCTSAGNGLIEITHYNEALACPLEVLSQALEIGDMVIPPFSVSPAGAHMSGSPWNANTDEQHRTARGHSAARHEAAARHCFFADCVDFLPGTSAP